MQSIVSHLLHPQSAGKEQLLQVRHRLLDGSNDAHSRYTAGWLALEAARLDSTPEADEAYDLAIDDWTGSRDNPETVYEDGPEVIRSKSELCLTMAQPLRYVYRAWET